MKQFFESIRVVNGKIMNLFWHQKRVDTTCETFGLEKVDLFLYTRIYDFQSKGLVKLRISYGEKGMTISWSPYEIANISRVAIVKNDNIEYSFKSEERTALLSLYALRGDADEVIISKSKFLHDSSYGNIIFYDGKEWLTPTHYLLNGTMRQKLIARKMIREIPIHENDIFHFQSLKIINAMRPPDEVEAIPINKDSILF